MNAWILMLQGVGKVRQGGAGFGCGGNSRFLTGLSARFEMTKS